MIFTGPIFWLILLFEKDSSLKQIKHMFIEQDQAYNDYYEEVIEIFKTLYPNTKRCMEL